MDAGLALANTVAVNAAGPNELTVPPATDSVLVPVSDAVPRMEVHKGADTSGLSSPPVAGETVIYTITVENTGNVSLLEPDLADALTDANGTPRSLTIGPDYVGGDAGGGIILGVGEIWTYTATVRVPPGDP